MKETRMQLNFLGLWDQQAIVKKLAAADPERYAAAAERLEVKARRAAQRRQEQLQHEKKLRQGVKKHRSGKTEPAAPSPKDHGAEKKPAAARPAVRKTAASRFPGSRPVKKGKGSVKKSK